MRHILIFCTRSLCYFSGEFFARELAEIFHALGDEVETVILPDEPYSTANTRDISQFEILNQYIGKHFDAIIDFNSFLPYLSDDDGTPILDEIDAPFFNYLLDHPLYHHPGLMYPVKNYNVICIDKAHAIYVRKYYPHIKRIYYLPLPGAFFDSGEISGINLVSPEELIGKEFIKSEIFDERAFTFSSRIKDDNAMKRSNHIFFSGTFMPENELLSELDRRPPLIREAVSQISNEWNPENEPIEDAVRKYLLKKGKKECEKIFNVVKKMDMGRLEKFKGASVQHNPDGFAEEEKYFPLLMNYMYSLDRIVRYRMRRRVIFSIARAGIEMDIQGEGFEKCLIPEEEFGHSEISSEQGSKAVSLSDFPNVHFINPAPMAESLYEIKRHEFILDINPLFFHGLHDRVTTALVNGCEVFSNMNKDTVPVKYREKLHHYSSYDTDDLIRNIKKFCKSAQKTDC